MDAFFTPIFVIMMVCLLLECLSLLLGDQGMAVACRLIIMMLVYLGYVLKRDITERALKQKSRKLVQLHVYVLFICCTVSSVFHFLLIYMLRSSRLYSFCVMLISLPVVLDEYQEITWLKERQRFHKMQRKQLASELVPVMEEVELRPSLYYTFFRGVQQHPLLYKGKRWLEATDTVAVGIV